VPINFLSFWIKIEILQEVKKKKNFKFFDNFYEQYTFEMYIGYSGVIMEKMQQKTKIINLDIYLP
jgi:hypothetical protein